MASVVEVLAAVLSTAGLFFLEAADSFLAVGVYNHVSNAQVRTAWYVKQSCGAHDAHIRNTHTK